MSKNKKKMVDHALDGAIQQELTSLYKENKALHETIDNLIQRINELEGIQEFVDNQLEVQEEITEVQLQRLRLLSRERPLTLDETRKFDLLIKNRKKEEEDMEPNYRELSESADVQDLLGVIESGDKKEETGSISTKTE